MGVCHKGGIVLYLLPTSTAHSSLADPGSSNTVHKYQGLQEKSSNGTRAVTTTASCFPPIILSPVHHHSYCICDSSLLKVYPSIRTPTSLLNTKTFPPFSLHMRPLHFHPIAHGTVLLTSCQISNFHMGVYTLSQPEQKTIEEYVLEGLRQGYIALEIT